MWGNIKTVLRNISIYLILFISGYCCAPIHQRNVTLHTSVTPQKKYHSSVALIETMRGERGHVKWYATAWAIDENHLLTAGHFCDSVVDSQMMKKASQKIRVVAADEKGLVYEGGEAEILDWRNDTYEDICILYIENHLLDPLPISRRVSELETEDKVTMVGAPRGYFPVRRDGYIRQVTKEYISAAIEIQPGASGSPLIWNGEVIGMIITVEGKLHEAGKAVPADMLLVFIEEHIGVEDE